MIRLLLCNFCFAIVALTPIFSTRLQAQEAQWVSLFDGKTLDGWEKVGKEDSKWEVKDGALAGSGTQSMLVYTCTFWISNFIFNI